MFDLINKDTLMLDLDKHKSLKWKEFPYLMGIVHKHSANFNHAKAEILAGIEKFLDTPGIMDRLKEFIHPYASREEIISAYLSIIKRDFFGKGWKRERIALEVLKSANPGASWTNDTSQELEYMGIDIAGTWESGMKVYVSVKGYKYDSTDQYEHYLERLKETKRKLNSTVALFMVDEHTRKIKHITIK